MRTTHLWLPMAAALSVGCTCQESPSRADGDASQSQDPEADPARAATPGVDPVAETPPAAGRESVAKQPEPSPEAASQVRQVGRWGGVRIEPRTTRKRLAPACEVEVTMPAVVGLPEAALHTLEPALQAEFDALRKSLFADVPCAGATEELPHGFEASYEIGGERNGLVGVELQATAFTGGAHSNALLRCVVLDLAEGRVLMLEPLLTAAGRVRLSDVATRRLAQEHGVTRLSEAGFFVDRVHIENPGSLCLTNDGIRVVFQQYEVAPFALGFPAVTLESKELAGAFGPGAPPGLLHSSGARTP